ncbi:hypothetical protein 2 [Wenling picorna-like virus 2]|uniref:hypothetical protein 2 n=1 Tax=Wenling picorna-like virus 2 TaxID=1923530 RepID=UPI00090989F6|nr:hypothetical protein 2 [Wenling picorna-like virus 2]APG78491.1 hypothetical protein 2 [Wenling picorna-like virus 2]
MTAETTNNISYDHDQNTTVDSTRGNLLTDVQMSALETPMPSSTTALALNDTTRHEIKTILERPVNLGTFDWTTNDPHIQIHLKPSDYATDKADYVKKFDFPQDIFKESPIVVDKLKNYQYLKADIEIEVKINAQPFLQGALMLVYNPYYDNTLDFRRKGTHFLASQTSCPYKIVSVEEGNSLKLTCPYANIYDLFDLSNSNNQFGTVFLYVFSPLRGPESNESAKFTVFARFVNPEFYVPSSNDTMSEYRDAHEISRLEQRGYRVGGTPYAQSLVTPSASKDTGEVTTTGPVSYAAGVVATVADVLSGVPVVGSVASTVAWVSRAAQGVASVFGWSKPTSIVPQTKSVLKPLTSLVHTEGNDDSTTLALLQDNGIDGSSFIPETHDEMALSYVFGRPNYFHKQTADHTLFSDRKLITAWEVSPFSTYQYGLEEDPNTLFLGSFAYASMFGTLWRGTINYDVMTVKTPYHQGRFAVVFLPETTLDQVPEKLGELLNTNYNVICNLKDRQDEMGRTTFRISVPFISNTPWRETYKRAPYGVPVASTLETSTGCCAIYSLVDLSYPPTVSDEVSFYIAHSGGEDYQIARPVLNLSPGFESLRYAQSDVGPVFIPADENLLVPSSSSKDVTAQTTGEYFQSLRALMKRFNPLCYIKQVDEYIGFRTRHMMEDSATGRRVASHLQFTNYVYPTSWYMVSFLYRFYSGSSMMKLLPSAPGAMGSAYLKFTESKECVDVLSEQDSIGQPVFSQLQQVSNAFEVRTPYYRGIRCDVVSSAQTPVLNDVRTCVRMKDGTGYGSSTSNTQVFEAAGDDFTFFFLIGPPPMMDIKAITDTTTFPNGEEIKVDLSTIHTLEDFDSALETHPVTMTPELPLKPGTNYPIRASENLPLGAYPVHKDGGLIEFVPAQSCLISHGDNGHYLIIPYEGGTVNNAETETALRELPVHKIIAQV